ncbi:hypothetical protein DFO58_3412 [Arthrobacter sp. AG1021]|nr:hypothetical protein DFO58_3412 [Arthrobacter sp. AG1021]
MPFRRKRSKISSPSIMGKPPIENQDNEVTAKPELQSPLPVTSNYNLVTFTFEQFLEHHGESCIIFHYQYTMLRSYETKYMFCPPPNLSVSST